ncbi:hypothetical protein DVH24_005682 [Malus domestica]|uniref:Uncharacterized protein n=1 Tax=Malus domestica TaxID=3750 RepID=A0A498IJT4_MALDO|nr:hypothetical protein DVH24_005682 [Malus domestica]
MSKPSKKRIAIWDADFGIGGQMLVSGFLNHQLRNVMVCQHRVPGDGEGWGKELEEDHRWFTRGSSGTKATKKLKNNWSSMSDYGWLILWLGSFCG